MADNDYTTKLGSADEELFQAWVHNNNIPFDPSPTADYDMRGFWKGLTTGDPRATTAIDPSDQRRHFPDTWKTPFHKSFSNESIYAGKDAPHWDGDTLIDNFGNIVRDESIAQDPVKGSSEKPLSLLDGFRTQSPQWKDRSDADVLGAMRLKMAPYMDQDKFDVLARDPYGRAAIEEEAHKITGLEALRKKFPGGPEQDDDFLKAFYDRFTARADRGEQNGIDRRITSFEDFRDLMNPKPGVINSAWHAWQAVGRGASSSWNQLSGVGYRLIGSGLGIESWTDAIYQALDSVIPGKPMQTIRKAAGDWWQQRFNEIEDFHLRGTDPTITPKEFGRAFPDFVNWLMAQGNAQTKQAAIDNARKDQAIELAKTTGGAIGQYSAKTAGFLGQQGVSMTMGTLLAAMPGYEASTAAVLAGAVQGTINVNEALQAHSDHALLEGAEGFTTGMFFRHMMEAPNGKVITPFVNLVADTGEETTRKWLRGEKIDWFDTALGGLSDVLLGVVASRDPEKVYREKIGSYKSPPDLFYPEKQRPLSSEMVLGEVVPEIPFSGEEPIGTRLSESILAKTVGPLPRGVGDVYWRAATEEFEKAAQARETGDNQKASQFIDRGLSILPKEEQRAIAKTYLEHIKDGNKPVQPIQEIQQIGAPEPVDPDVAIAHDLIRHTFFGLTPKAEPTIVAPEVAPEVAPVPVVPEPAPEVAPVPVVPEPTPVVPKPAVTQPGIRLKEGTAQHKLAMARLIKSGMSEAEARQRISETRTAVVNVAGRGRDVAEQILKPAESVENRILGAYDVLTKERKRRSISIAELAARAHLPVDQLQNWILTEGVPALRVQLDEGDWASASPAERAASVRQHGRPRLYIAIDPEVPKPRSHREREAGYTINFVGEVYDWVREHWPKTLRGGFYFRTFEPQHISRGLEARGMWLASKRWTARTQQAFGAYTAEAARALGLDKVLRGAEKVFRRAAVFDKLSLEQIKELLAQSEEGLVHSGNPDVDWLMNKFYRPLFKAINLAERAAGFMYKAHEFYFYHALPRDQQERFVQWYDNYLTSDPRWTQKRQLPTYRTLFEAGFRPKVFNPERLFQMRLGSSFQAIRKVMTLRDAVGLNAAIAKSQWIDGELKDVLSKEETARLGADPDYTRVSSPNNESYFVKKNAWQVVKNAWEPSRLYTDFGLLSGIARGLATAKGVSSRTMLGISIVHPAHIALVYPAWVATRIERNLLGPARIRQFHESLQDMLKNPETSSRIMNDWRGIKQRDGTPQELSPDEKAVKQDILDMGLSLDVSEETMMQFNEWLREQFPKWRNVPGMMAGKFVEAGYRALESATLQDFSFKQMIPFMKLSAAIQAREALYQKSPELLNGANEFKRRDALGKIGDQIDLRFGEINYANVYWNKLAKDLGQMMFLSMGWTMGTTRFVGDAVHDMSSNIIHIGELKNKFLGKPSEHTFLTDRLLMTMNYSAMAMVANATRQYIWTGLTTGQPQLPQGEDYVFPRISKNDRGEWVRARPVEFITEIPMWFVHAQREGGVFGPGALTGTLNMAINKLNPILSNVVHDFQNKNYFGQKIRSRLDPPTKQWEDFAKTLLIDPSIPITVQQAMKTGKWDWVGFASSFFGLPPASAEIGRTHTENLIMRTYYDEFPGALNPEAQEFKNAHLALSHAVMSKNQAQINEAVTNLKRLGLSQEGINRSIKHAATTPLDFMKAHFKRLNPAEQKKIMQQMTPTERKIYYPSLHETLRPKTPERARALPVGTEFFDTEGNLRTRP